MTSSKGAPSRYLVWAPRRVEGACVLLPLMGVEKQFELLEGVPRAAGFPSGASFSMSPDYPDNMLLTDSLINIDMMIVASARLKALFEERAAPAVEHLPVTIFDHRDQPAPAPYFILHPTHPVDCLDLQASGATRSRISPAAIMGVRSLILDERRVDPARLLFRPLGFPPVTLVRRDVAEEIDRAGFTGVRFIEPSSYPEI